MFTTITNGYKATDKNMKCLDYQYTMGEVHKTDKMIMCDSGFHFCKNLKDTNAYYDIRGTTNRLFAIEAYGDVETQGNKSVTKRIKFIREIPKIEALRAIGDEVDVDSEDRIIRHKWSDKENYGYTTFEKHYSYDVNGNQIVNSVYRDGKKVTSYYIKDDGNKIYHNHFQRYDKSYHGSPIRKVRIVDKETGNDIETNVYLIKDVNDDISDDNETLIEHTSVKTIDGKKVEIKEYLELHPHGALSKKTITDDNDSTSTLTKHVNDFKVVFKYRNDEIVECNINKGSFIIEYNKLIKPLTVNHSDHSDKILKIKNIFSGSLYDLHGDDYVTHYAKINYNDELYETKNDFYHALLLHEFGMSLGKVEKNIDYKTIYHDLMTELNVIENSGKISKPEYKEEFIKNGLIVTYGYGYASLTKKAMLLIAFNQNL